MRRMLVLACLLAVVAGLSVYVSAQGRAMAAHVRGLGREFHLPLIDLALPAVKAAPEPAKHEHLAALEAVVNADRRVSLHEFVVLTLVRDQIMAKDKRDKPQSKKLAELAAEAATVLYDAPSAKSRPLFVVNRGYPVEIIVTVEGWTKVRDSGLKRG